MAVADIAVPFQNCLRVDIQKSWFGHGDEDLLCNYFPFQRWDLRNSTLDSSLAFFFLLEGSET